MPDELLALARRLLEGNPLLEEFAAECSRVQAEYQEWRERSLVQAHADPQAALLSAEVSALLNSFDQCLEWLELCQDYLGSLERDCLEQALDSASSVFGRLQFDFFRLQRATWSVRGPVTHPGINRILDSEEELESIIPEEIDLQQSLEQQWHAQPGAWAQRCLQWSHDYLELLQSERGDDWLDAIQGLGEQFTPLDLEPLARRFAAGPSCYAWINLAIHSPFLLNAASIDPTLAEHIFESAHDQLTATVESAQSASAEEYARVAAEVTADLVGWLEEGVQLKRQFKQDVYSVWAEDGIELAEELRTTLQC